MNYILKKSLVVLFASIQLLVGCTAVYTRPESTIIREIVNNYRMDDPYSKKTIDQLFLELDRANPKAAGTWKRIMDYWDYVNTAMPINPFELPGELIDTDEFCIIVLGYELQPNGEMKGELRGRLEVAKKCAEDYPNAYILCTGGGTAAYNGTVTEAGVMANWLKENGVDEARILVEDKSIATTQNAQFCWELLSAQYPQVKYTAIVSSDYHIPWAIVLFQTQFLLQGGDISVISNAAFVPEVPHTIPFLHYQRGGILEIAHISKWGIF